jgi:hypothetical protein
MRRKSKASELEDEMRPEYDLSKMKLVGRGIYAARYRKGVKFFLLSDHGAINNGEVKEDRLNEQPRNISNPTEQQTD